MANTITRDGIAMPPTISRAHRQSTIFARHHPPICLWRHVRQRRAQVLGYAGQTLSPVQAPSVKLAFVIVPNDSNASSGTSVTSNSSSFFWS
jgi:hypothetical protein